jgi:hypothetical protein
MRDEMEGRFWAEHGHHFSEDVSRFLKAVNVTFCRMAAINFAAPWRKSANDC